MTVDQGRFVSAMRDRWQTLGNTPNAALEAVWRQIGETFNRHIQNHGTEAGKRWTILQPATGTGKTLGLAVYCGLLGSRAESYDYQEALKKSLLEGSDTQSPDALVGVLIVTRLKQQADDLARDINAIAGRPAALARHSDSRPEPGEVSAAQVLVVTHAAYEGALDRFQGVGDQQWSSFTQWDNGPRQLIVIDEAIDLVKPSQVILDDVSFVLGVIPHHVAVRFPNQWLLLQEVQKLLAAMGDLATQRAVAGQPERERVLWHSNMAQMPATLTMSGLRSALRGLEWDQIVNRKKSASDKAALAVRVDGIIASVEATIQNWRWYSKKGQRHTLNTSALIVPDDIEGAVVLDATAGDDLVYDLFDKKAERLMPPAAARTYANVRLHFARMPGVGKSGMIAAAQQRVAMLMADLQHDIARDDCGGRDVFVCCHKAVQPELEGIRHPFASLRLAHWGEIDGRNDWQSCDTAVIFGLPYRDRIWSANTFMAFQGLQSNEWLNDPTQRRFKDFTDIRQALEVHQLIVSVVQAINRVRCRKVVDGAGNCARTDVYIYLPPDKTGDAILHGIKRNMPGVQVCAWVADVAKAKPVKRSRNEEALVAHLRIMPRGEMSAAEMRGLLRVSKPTWARLAAQMKDEASILFARLAELGAAYAVRGLGKAQRAYLVKA